MFLPLKFQKEVWLYPYVKNTRWKSGWLTDHSTHSFIHACTHSPTHSLIHACTHSPTHSLLPCSRVIIKKLIGPQLITKFPHFMEPKGSFTTTCHSSLSSSQMNPVHAFPSHFFLLILSTYLTYFFQVVAFLQDFPTKPRAHLSFPPHMCHMK